VSAASDLEPRAPAAPFPRIARAILIAAGVLPWLVAPARAWLPLGRAGEALDQLFIPMCHRLPARTLLIAGVAMPLCSRCAGIFAGVAIGAILVRPRWPLRRWAIPFAIACALMLLDVATQDAGLHPVWHLTRLATGALFGYAVGAACTFAVREAAADAR
jgi:uncharacterized membrane protein